MKKEISESVEKISEALESSDWYGPENSYLYRTIKENLANIHKLNTSEARPDPPEYMILVEKEEYMNWWNYSVFLRDGPLRVSGANGFDSAGDAVNEALTYFTVEEKRSVLISIT